MTFCSPALTLLGCSENCGFCITLLASAVTQKEKKKTGAQKRKTCSNCLDLLLVSLFTLQWSGPGYSLRPTLSLKAFAWKKASCSPASTVSAFLVNLNFLLLLRPLSENLSLTETAAIRSHVTIVTYCAYFSR